MAFSHAQTSVSGSTSGSSTSTSAVLSGAPAQGDLVCVSVVWFNATNTPPASITVADSNSNSYTKSTNSPTGSPNANSSGFTYIFFLNNAPANASATVTATYSDPGVSGFVELIVDDFTVSGGTSAFDQDATGTGTGTTSIVSPTVPTTGTGELLYCYASASTSVTAVNSPWTTGKITVNGTASGYILSAGATALNMTMTSGNFNSIGASFTFTASAPVIIVQPGPFKMPQLKFIG